MTNMDNIAAKIVMKNPAPKLADRLRALNAAALAIGEALNKTLPLVPTPHPLPIGDSHERE
jgi:hypothetical protein